MTVHEYFGNWLNAIDQKELAKVTLSLNLLYATEPVVPEYSNVFKAFRLCSFEDCRVVFLGQDKESL